MERDDFRCSITAEGKAVRCGTQIILTFSDMYDNREGVQYPAPEGSVVAECPDQDVLPRQWQRRFMPVESPDWLRIINR